MNVPVTHANTEVLVRMKSTAIIVNVPLATRDVCVKLVCNKIIWLQIIYMS